ncbi:cell surface protein [Metarhizium album ARSEF 1941]|uniref:Cell surface protein n=1 Tax=Metarhizium album (strain ARSEF 1941) TaxID=1081103 RepID=A0A0B2WXF6_METAS|nr:cell surface protein [Metarhizium album ARSEF 1941]KHN97555.1 cell surface protein [Metarhizium album ARSEF 1941]
MLRRIAAYPEVNFLVVVNPNSGPGSDPLPGNDYVREVPRLNAFANVHTVGYVRIHYCEKALAEACAEIERYASWSRHQHIPGLHVQGIYVDETPNHYSAGRAQYLERLGHFIKTNPGLAGTRTVVHNPGTPPEGDLASFGSPDLVCICEEPYERYLKTELQERLRDLSPEHERCIYQISGIPPDKLGGAVRELCRRGQYVFATDLPEDFYESFGPSWLDFVAAVSAAAALSNDGCD